MYNRYNVGLRLPLHSFIGADCESEIIAKIEDSYTKIPVNWELHMWFDDNQVTYKEVSEFTKKHEDSFKYRTFIKARDACQNPNYYVQFEVEDINNPMIDKSNQCTSNHRFKYSILSGEQIIKGLDKFIEISNFILTVNERTSYKPRKKYER
jgi:hypothetical protein|tara:strand:+ start:3973 stop:4428 length:456 start_codon:yes stop_codon:yes gene_type:complete